MKKTVHKNPYFQVVQEGSYFYIDYNRLHSGVVMVCEVDGKILFIKTYRFPIKKDQWELPRGFIDAKETPVVAAKRELLEETGYEGSAEVIGFITPDSGSMNNIVPVVLMKAQNKKEDKGSEVKEMALVASEDLDAFMRTNYVADAFTLSALWFYRLRNQKD